MQAFSSAATASPASTLPFVRLPAAQHALAASPCSLIRSLTDLSRLPPADVEKRGAASFLKDLGSRNKVSLICCCFSLRVMCTSSSARVEVTWCTYEVLAAQTWLEHPGSAATALQPQDRYALQSGDIVKFGSMECRVHFSPEGVVMSALFHFSRLGLVADRGAGATWEAGNLSGTTTN